MQNAATGARELGYIDIFPTDKGIHTQNGVAMISLAINRVASIGKMGPGLICQVFKVRLVGIRKAPALGITLECRTVYFLEENDVCTCFSDAFAHGVQYKAAIAAAVALVNVIGKYVYIFAHKLAFMDTRSVLWNDLVMALP